MELVCILVFYLSIILIFKVSFPEIFFIAASVLYCLFFLDILLSLVLYYCYFIIWLKYSAVSSFYYFIIFWCWFIIFLSFFTNFFFVCLYLTLFSQYIHAIWNKFIIKSCCIQILFYVLLLSILLNHAVFKFYFMFCLRVSFAYLVTYIITITTIVIILILLLCVFIFTWSLNCWVLFYRMLSFHKLFYYVLHPLFFLIIILFYLFLLW